MDKKSILLIETFPHLQTFISHFLEGLGHDVTIASDGSSITRCIYSIDFDMIITGSNIPGYSEFGVIGELCKYYEDYSQKHQSAELNNKLRGSDSKPRPYLIIMTDEFNSLAEREKRMEVGVDGWLQKPINLDELEQVVEKFFLTIPRQKSSDPQARYAREF